MIGQFSAGTQNYTFDIYLSPFVCADKKEFFLERKRKVEAMWDLL